MRLVLLLFIFVSFNLDAQNALWTQTVGFNGSGNDAGWELALDHQNNVITAGFLKNDAYAGPNFLPGYGTHDLFVAKYDTDGNLLWANRHGSADTDQYRDVVVDEQGNIYCAGYISGNTQIGWYSANLMGTNRDAIIVKYDPAGNVVWVKQYYGTYAGYTNKGTIDVEYTQGKLYVGMVYTDSINIDGAWIPAVDFEDMMLIEMDTAGNTIQFRRYGGQKIDVFHCLTVDPSDNSLYLSGITNGFIYFNGILHQNSMTSYSDAFLVKIDTTFTAKWVKSFGGILDQGVNKIKVLNPDNIFLIGDYDDTIIYDNGAASGGAPGTGSELFIMNIDSSGSVNNFLSYGGDGNQVNIDMKINNQEILISGSYNQYMVYGTDTLPNISPKNLCILNIDTSLSLNWHKVYEGYPQSGKSPSITGLEVDSCGYIYFTGSVMDTVWYDSVLTMGSGWSLDVITAKMNPKPEAGYVASQNAICPNDSIVFTDVSGCSTQSRTWSINGGVLNNDSTETASVYFDSSGTYEMQLIIYDGWTYDTISSTVSVHSVTQPDIGEDTTICQQSIPPGLILDAGNYNTYNWSTGESTQTIEVTNTGMYYVEVTDVNGCPESDTINVQVTNCDGISEVAEMEVEVYPIPSQGMIRISSDETAPVNVNVISMDGRVVERESFTQNTSLELGHLTPGTYILQISSSDNNDSVNKLIILQP